MRLIIAKNRLFFGLLFLFSNISMIRMEYLQQVSIAFTVLFRGLLFICLALALLYYFLLCYIEKPVIYLFYFSGIILFSTLLRSVSIEYFMDYLISFGTLWLAILTLEIGIQKSPEVYINCIFYYLLITLTINTILGIMYPSGLYSDLTGFQRAFLMGSDNTSVRYFILFMLFGSLETIYIHNKKYSWHSIYAFFISMLFFFSRDIGTGKVVISICGILLFVHYILNNNFVLTMRMSICINLLFLLIIVIFRNQLTIIEYVVTRFVGKSSTFTGRTFLWDEWVAKISERVMIGYGYERQLYRITGTYVNSAFGPHNRYLLIIVYGGLIAFSVFLIILFYISLQYDRTIKDLLVNKDKSYSIVSIFVFLILLQGQVETDDFFPTMIVLFIAFHVRDLYYSHNKNCSLRSIQFTDRTN